MSGKKFCRLCLNKVLTTSANILYASDVHNRNLLMNIFPGMNISLTNSIRLCEECFNNVNFVTRVHEGFQLKKKQFLYSAQASSVIGNYCRLCFTVETPCSFFVRSDNYPPNILKGMLEIALSINDWQHIIDTNICGVCWSWIKKIYIFKRQCFTTEETLKLFCIQRNLHILKDSDLEVFLAEQYYAKTAEICRKKEEVEQPINLSTVQHQQYFEATGEVYSNLDDGILEKVENELFFEEEDKKHVAEVIDESKGPILHHNTSQISTIPLDNTCSNLENKNPASDDFNLEIKKSHTKHNINNMCIVIDVDTEENIDTNNAEQSSMWPESSRDPDLLNPNVREHLLESLEDYREHQQDHFESQLITDKSSNLPNADHNNNSTIIKWGSAMTSIDPVKSNVDQPEDSISKTVICCDTPQYSELFNRYVRNYLEPSTDRYMEDDCTNSVQYVTNIYNINVIPQENGNKVSDVVEIEPNTSVEKNRENASKNKNYVDMGVFEFNEDDGESAKKGSGNDVLFVDEDCYEVLDGASDVIDLTKIDSFADWTDRKSIAWGCYVCITKFEEKKNLRRHCLNHEDPWNKYGRFQCNRCPFRANWKGTLTRHMHQHSKKILSQFAGKRIYYYCPYCSSIFTTKGEIQSHMTEHIISWKVFQCLDCMYNTNMSQTLRSHYRNCHNNSKDPTY